MVCWDWCWQWVNPHHRVKFFSPRCLAVSHLFVVIWCRVLILMCYFSQWFVDEPVKCVENRAWCSRLLFPSGFEKNKTPQEWTSRPWLLAPPTPSECKRYLSDLISINNYYKDVPKKFSCLFILVRVRNLKISKKIEKKKPRSLLIIAHQSIYCFH